jgi:hypothetical protein
MRARAKVTIRIPRRTGIAENKRLMVYCIISCSPEL